MRGLYFYCKNTVFWSFSEILAQNSAIFSARICTTFLIEDCHMVRLLRRFSPGNDVSGVWLARHDGRGVEWSDFAVSVKVSKFEGYSET